MFESECKQCDGGYYCDVSGLFNMIVQCVEGYYCQSGVNIVVLSNNNIGFGGKMIGLQRDNLEFWVKMVGDIKGYLQDWQLRKQIGKIRIFVYINVLLQMQDLYYKEYDFIIKIYEE